jgi:hypothetical protein
MGAQIRKKEKKTRNSCMKGRYHRITVLFLRALYFLTAREALPELLIKDNLQLENVSHPGGASTQLRWHSFNAAGAAIISNLTD